MVVIKSGAVMKMLFSVALLLSTTLYTMDCVPKKHKTHPRDEHTKLINMDHQYLHDIVMHTTLNDIKKRTKKRKRIKESDCLPRLNTFIAETSAFFERYFKE